MDTETHSPVQGARHVAMPMAVRPFEMVPLGKPIELVRIQSPPIASLEFTIYVAADTLRSARLTTVSAEWEVFREHASAAVNRTISKNDLASLVKHGPYTIKRALGEAGVSPPRNMKVISDLEAFMAKMYAEQFRNLDARLAVVMRKRKKASPPETEGDEEPSKRSRTSLSKLGKEFIDYYRYRSRYRHRYRYRFRYRSLSGDTHSRNRLYKTIYDTALTREESLDSSGWTTKIIATRLRNALSDQNREIEAAELD